MTSNHKAFYRRMGIMEEHSGGNAVSISLLPYQPKDVWRSPRGTVLRIEALALVAITLSFFLAFFGSCRRWSNRWIVQKAFWAAQVLSLSIGTYSIGLMQSSSVKSEMYPLWAVSLLTLFGCIDPITTYIDLDYKGPLSRMIFQLCLYFGYVMLMGVSTISSHIGKLAIGVLSTITFIKSFHRSLAFVLPGQIREDIWTEWIEATEPAALAGDGKRLKVHLPMYLLSEQESDFATMEDIKRLPKVIKDVCLGYSFSHLLRQRFLGFDTSGDMRQKRNAFERLVQDSRLTRVDYMRALEVVEVELAFLFDAFFTSNEFLHFYQVKTLSFWALASFIAICFVGVVAAIIPGAMASRQSIVNSEAATSGPGAQASVPVNIVPTTAADLIITLVVLVSLALLQLLQLILCWTSNWARVGIACEYAIKAKKLPPKKEKAKKQMLSDDVEVTSGDGPIDGPQRPYEKECCSWSNIRSSSSNNQIISRWVMGLRLFVVARVNWFDKYLWQAKLGQDSVAAVLQRSRARDRRQKVFVNVFCCCGLLPKLCLRWLHSAGVIYFWTVITALFFSDTRNPGGAVKLHDDVKASIAEFLGTIKSRRIEVEWSALFIENGLQDWFRYLPYRNRSLSRRDPLRDKCRAPYEFSYNVMICHIATWYCEEADKAAGCNSGAGEGGGSREKNRRVAIHLSKYCVYLVVSAPELLPVPAARTKKALEYIEYWTEKALEGQRNMLEAAARVLSGEEERPAESPFDISVRLGQKLLDMTATSLTTDHWELLARLWVQTLLYAAPYGDVQAHMQHLSQGGEFITHLWALLYHLGIDEWEAADINELEDAAAAAAKTAAAIAETTTEADDAGSGGLEIN